MVLRVQFCLEKRDPGNRHQIQIRILTVRSCL
uniref:Uncharacterized protein n=1 Tax=Anguilla anguilla TaxID=7936 RepID=A0A0E9PYC4_ANGAN